MAAGSADSVYLRHERDWVDYMLYHVKADDDVELPRLERQRRLVEIAMPDPKILLAEQVYQGFREIHAIRFDALMAEPR